MIVYWTFAVIIGVCAGSFVNVLIYRLPRGLPFVRDTSKCTVCGAGIRPYDLIPIVSYVILHGRCRDCKSAVSARYPVIEAVSGGLAVLTCSLYGFSLTALLYFSFFAVLLTISSIDMEHMIIPNGLTAVLAVLSAVHTVLFWGETGFPDIYSRIFGFFIISVPMYALAVAIEDAFGGGDIKLIAVCGFMLGLRLILLAAFLAFFFGGFWGIYIKYFKKDKTTKRIAFGQYICFGVFIALAYGEWIISAYLSVVYYPMSTG